MTGTPAPTSARFLRSIELSPVMRPTAPPTAAPMKAWRCARAGCSSRVYGSSVVHAGSAMTTPASKAATVKVKLNSLGKRMLSAAISKGLGVFLTADGTGYAGPTTTTKPALHFLK